MSHILCDNVRVLRIRAFIAETVHFCYAWHNTGLEEIYDQDMLEIKDVESQQSGKYVCMATNCMHRSIRSNVSSYNIQRQI